MTSEFSRAQRTLGRPQPSPVGVALPHLERRWRGPPVKGLSASHSGMVLRSSRGGPAIVHSTASPSAWPAQRWNHEPAGQVRVGTESIAPHRSWADRVVSFRTSQASLCCRPCPTRRGRPACPLAPSSPSIVAGPSSCGRCRASASPQRTPISGGQNLSTLGSCTPWSDPPRDWRTVTGGSRRVGVPSELFLRLLAGRTSVKENAVAQASDRNEVHFTGSAGSAAFVAATCGFGVTSGRPRELSPMR